MPKNKFKSYGFLLTIVFLFFVLRLPSLFEPYWYGDEGIYLVLGLAIRKGLTLYSQIHDNKPPTLYYLAAFSQTVFGFRLLLALSIAGATYIYHQLSQKILSPNLSKLSTLLFVIFASIPLIEGNIANAEVFMLFPTLAAIYYFFYNNSKYKLLISGLLLGFAFTIKIPVAVEFGFLFVWYFLFTKQKITIKLAGLIQFTAAFFFPFVLYSIYFVLKGVFSDFMFSSILQNFGYLSSWQTGSHSNNAPNNGLILRTITLFFAWFISYLLVAKKYVKSELGVLLFWFSSTIYGALLSARPYPHYLIQTLPPLILLLVSLFQQKLVKPRALIVLALLVFLLLVRKYNFYYYPVFSYYNNFYSHILSLNSSDYRNFFGWQVNDIYQISSIIKKNTLPTDKVFIWSDESTIYALSNRLPVGRFTVAYHISDFNQYQNTYNQLITVMPKIIVYSPQNNRPFPSLDKLVQTYYYPTDMVGNTIIYQFRSSRP